jgi:hypothetical protein
MEAGYLTTITLVKISILLFYRRLGSRAISFAFRWTLRVSIALVIIHFVVIPFPTFFGCQPIHAWWDEVNLPWLLTHTLGKDYHCIDEGIFFVTITLIGLLQDALVAFLPIILFWKLRLDRLQKFALASLFTIGGL